MCLLKSNSITVVSTAPGRRSIISSEGINQADHGAVSASDHQESADCDDKHTPGNHSGPTGRTSVVRMPVVVQPHTAHRLETDESPQEGADEGYQAAEIGDGAGDDVGYCYGTGGAEEPGYVVGWGRGG